MARARHTVKHFALITILTIWTAGCSSYHVNVQDPPPGFTLQLSPASISLTAAGAAQSVTITAVPANGFTGSVQVAITGLTQGVTATPSTLTLTPGAAQPVSLAASASATSGTANVFFTGTSGSLTETATL